MIKVRNKELIKPPILPKPNRFFIPAPAPDANAIGNIPNTINGSHQDWTQTSVIRLN
jgi:hypothetical protein